MYRFLAGTVCTLCLLITSTAEAQWVRVGPFGGVSVRAPFVAVDAVPWGGARVRAPFTSVNTGVFAYDYGPWYQPYRPYRSYRYYYPPPVIVEPVPVYPVPVYPEVIVPQVRVVPPATRYEVARPPITMAPEQIASHLRSAAGRLQRSLSMRRNDADVWLNYLAPDQIIQTIDQGGSPESLAKLLLNYDGVVGNRSLVSVRTAGGFADTHRLLRMFVDSGQAAASEAVPAPAPADDQNGGSILAPEPDPPPAEDLPPAKADEAASEPTPAPPVEPAPVEPAPAPPAEDGAEEGAAGAKAEADAEVGDLPGEPKRTSL